ncbi:sushi, von Willebrand factor type A, EGF and pentraxin domain-containing protein 1-like [Actinia tenebrosa]|uniref:Sushi, von Willebrand factor type A, EGF and pentraxin domain-containing protein 1-like n=1 Tax=Actinia tenebrosa TaxID=6105 RepID=A0A6P8HZ45_ACTTE|nr:sushi, von Willebrand factor type A, EGF and pentraxin domain-containing protein 1-like [Actinia tenebrosa]
MAPVQVKAVNLLQALFLIILFDELFAEQDQKLRINVLKPEFKSDPEGLLLHRDQANNFRESHGRRRRDLWEECYDEGCSKEEVEEVVSGHALHQYYYGWRCMKLYGSDWTYSGNPSTLQCSNILRDVKVCVNSRTGVGRSQSRNCYFGSAKNVYAVYMENGCNDGKMGNWKLTFNDPSNSVRYVYNVGCRDKENFATVRGATMYSATLVGGGGGDGYISNYKLGWFGYDSKNCGHPGVPANGNLIGNNFYETSQVTYTCRYGYTRVGNERRTCQWHGWDGSLPVCKRLCDPGTYSSRGYEPCTPCRIGTYQPNKRSRSCISCPGGKSTDTTGKRFLSDCHHKCSKAVCNLQAWSQWSDSDSSFENQCASQIRKRFYKKTWQEILDPSGCDSVNKVCPPDQSERRQRVVYCDPLPEPEYGYYLPKNCTITKQACKSVSSSVCMFFCGKGFDRQGTDADFRRVCKADGRWTTSSAKCKDTMAPEITCPENVEVGNERGKSYARVNLPNANATDNSGKTPSIRISTPNIEAMQIFQISETATTVYYSATDDAGLTSNCSFTVKVKDTEKPQVLECPKEHLVYTSERPKRVVFPEPKFQDNYDTAPVITASHKPGALFYWKKYTLTFSARDKAGNTATCSYPLQVGPLTCPLYDPPANGIRSCNIKVNEAKQEYVCVVQCNENYDFDEKPEWSSYACMNGAWNGYKFPIYQQLPEGRPWKDCAVKSSPTGVAKNVKVYAGSCLSGNEETQKKIKEQFLEFINQDPLLSSMFSCLGNNNVDCQLANVKVSKIIDYCLFPSRGLDENAYVIDIKMKVLDLNPDSSSLEKQKLKDIETKMLANKQIVDDAIKRATSMVMKVQVDSVDVEDEDVKGACALGKVVVVKSGSGSELDRSVCVDCSAGTYYSKDAEACVQCKNGTYQDTEGQVYCKVCPGGTSTIGRGAKSLQDCKGICEGGRYSTTGLETCVACSVGKYQPNNHSTSCLPCPAGTSTFDIGTTSIEDCKKLCTAGQFSKHGGLGACLPCPRGTYQPNAKEKSCIKCPSGMTTVGDGSTSKDQCKSSCRMDFENSIDHWTKTGTAFNNQPTYGDNPRFRNRESAQQQGNWWIGGAENRPSPSHPAGQIQGDGPTGTLTSPTFQITGKSLSFLIGGGCDVTKVRVELLIDGLVVKRETGRCFESMERRCWDVSEYQGKVAQVRLVDQSTGSWGHINFDDLRGDSCI